jgi:hypothetical protein
MIHFLLLEPKILNLMEPLLPVEAMEAGGVNMKNLANDIVGFGCGRM